ncbi:MAG: efflux transporter periplasmic adaptor subunit, partial [Myxococcota bacterium]|nr:efflux transporter periplasmic adaptor subunit [Myxococcota bacterium]
VPRGAASHVLVVGGDGLVERRRVQLGLRRPGLVEVRDGLAAGERVVTHGAAGARPGEPVRIRASQQPGQPLAELLAAEERS